MKLTSRQYLHTIQKGYRGRAQSVKIDKKVNIILHDKDLHQLYYEVISLFNYYDVYNHSNLKKVGDNAQTDPTCPLTIGLTPTSKQDFFDADGVLLNPQTVVENGVLKQFFGSNRYAYYLNEKPTGVFNKIVVKKGTKSVDSFKKKPYVEILDLSGIQTDICSNYVGGEVRLAIYFDGKNTYPISGFSFSANLQESIDTIELSKEESDLPNYKGSKYALIKNVEIN
ncbi:MAG: metallopeptidase TldD-related protein [Clostridia bacterium]|nr:metallopeptidase TldD-related protein [Clostridia bacterium]